MSADNKKMTVMKEQIGKTYGPSKAFMITQDIIDQFARCTEDLDPLHIDPDWASANGPYPTTISFGFLTMSYLTAMAHDVFGYEREERDGSNGYPLNYGFNKLRFVAPVPVNSEITGTYTVKDVVERKPGQYLTVYEVVVNIKGKDNPAIVAEWLGLWVDG